MHLAFQMKDQNFTLMWINRFKLHREAFQSNFWDEFIFAFCFNQRLTIVELNKQS